MVICDTPSEDCYFRRCVACPGTDNLREIVQNKTITKDVSSFCEFFTESATNLVLHAHIAKEQSGFFRRTKEELEPSAALVVGDFSNYSFMV